jgi:hypothetical protein
MIKLKIKLKDEIENSASQDKVNIILPLLHFVALVFLILTVSMLIEFVKGS